MIQERYRSEYPGEFVILRTRIENGKKVQDREWIPNPVENQHISSRAAVIIDSIKSNWFKEGNLERHRGGHLGKIKLQTYGTEKSWKNLRLDFAFLTDADELSEMIDHDYQEKTAVYTNSVNCIKNPGEFFLLPHNPKVPSLTGILYLAAFDEYSEIFICGADSYGPSNYPTEKLQLSVSQVFRCFSKTKFNFVLNKKRSLPDMWRAFKNVNIIDHKTFVSYCDL